MEVEGGGRVPASGAQCASRDTLTLDQSIKRVSRQFLAKSLGSSFVQQSHDES